MGGELARREPGSMIVPHPNTHVALGSIHMAIGLIILIMELIASVEMGLNWFTSSYALSAMMYTAAGTLAMCAQRQDRCFFVATMTLAIISAVYAASNSILLMVLVSTLPWMYTVRLVVHLIETIVATAHSIFCCVFCCCRKPPTEPNSSVMDLASYRQQQSQLQQVAYSGLSQHGQLGMAGNQQPMGFQQGGYHSDQHSIGYLPVTEQQQGMMLSQQAHLNMVGFSSDPQAIAYATDLQPMSGGSTLDNQAMGYALDQQHPMGFSLSQQQYQLQQQQLQQSQQPMSGFSFEQQPMSYLQQNQPMTSTMDHHQQPQHQTQQSLGFAQGQQQQPMTPDFTLSKQVMGGQHLDHRLVSGYRSSDLQQQQKPATIAPTCTPHCLQEMCNSSEKIDKVL